MIVILDNLRSCHNVGSILRSADGFGISEVWYVGTTPYPRLPDDERLPHQITKLTNKIHKTALGAENLEGKYFQTIAEALNYKKNVKLVALEQTEQAIDINKHNFSVNDALIVGAEVVGVSKEFLDAADKHVYIPMTGNKESFNVSVAAAIAFYEYSSQMD